MIIFLKIQTVFLTFYDSCKQVSVRYQIALILIYEAYNVAAQLEITLEYRRQTILMSLLVIWQPQKPVYLNTQNFKK